MKSDVITIRPTLAPIYAVRDERPTHLKLSEPRLKESLQQEEIHNNVFEDSATSLIQNIVSFITSCRQDLDWYIRLRGSQIALGWAEEQSSLFKRLHDLPSSKWMEDFTSPTLRRRVDAYHIYNDALNSPVEAIGNTAPLIGPQGVWERVSTLLIQDPTSPTALISARCVIFRILGDVGPITALEKTQNALNTLQEDKQARKYTGPILAERHNSRISGSGSAYESERKLIQGHIRHVRWMYECLIKCLEDASIRERIFSVPDKYFRPEFPEISYVGHDLGRAPLPNETLLIGFEKDCQLIKKSRICPLAPVAASSSWKYRRNAQKILCQFGACMNAGKCLLCFVILAPIWMLIVVLPSVPGNLIRKN